MNPIVELLQAEIAAGKLTGITEDARYEGWPLLGFDEPEPERTEYGGLEVPALDEVREEHAALVDRLNDRIGAKVYCHIPRYHIYNPAADGNDSYALGLAADPEKGTEVQNVLARANVLYRLIKPKDGVFERLVNDDHAVWSAVTTPDDMAGWYRRNDIRNMKKFAERLGA